MAFPLKAPMWAPGIRQGHPLAPGLLRYWPHWTGSGDRVMDVSPNRGHGRLTGMDAATDWVTAESGHALAFDGAGGNEYVLVPDSDELDGMAALTVVVRAYLTSITAADEFVRKTDAYYCRMDVFLRASEFYVKAGGILRGPFSSPNNSLPTNEWVNVGFVADGANTHLYINGLSVAGGGAAPGNIAAVANPVSLGGSPDEATETINGQMDLAAMWSRALSPGEIEWLYRKPWDLITPRRLF